MFDFSIGIGEVLAVSLAGGSLVGNWFWIKFQAATAAKEREVLRKAVDTLAERLIANERELMAYRLEATDRFASVAHLKDVEQRLVEAIKSVVTEVHELRNDIQEMLRQVVGKNATNR